MVLDHAGRGDAHEASVVESLDILRAAVAHSGAETAEELVDGLGESPLVGYASHDAFRHEFA